MKAQKWIGKIIASYEGGKGNKMGLDHDGYLRREEDYDGDDQGECSTYQKFYDGGFRTGEPGERVRLE